MNILTILGSPRKKGNTAAVLDCFEALAAPRHSVERVNLTDYTVNGCLGCSRCQKHFDEPGCAQKDDALAIFARIMAADLTLYATPLYAWGFTAQMKALIDRHFCLIKWDADPVFSLLKGKHAALLVTCGDHAENNADLVQVMFDRQMECAKCVVDGKFIVDECSTPKEMGEKAARAAERMLREMRL